MKITIDGQEIEIGDGMTVASAIMLADRPAFRRSVRGGARFPLCGMGICFECRVTIDGEPHRRSCQTIVREGMEIMTG
jgi:sarcosine oxidase subunit alpha